MVKIRKQKLTLPSAVDKSIVPLLTSFIERLSALINSDFLTISSNQLLEFKKQVRYFDQQQHMIDDNFQSIAEIAY